MGHMLVAWIDNQPLHDGDRPVAGMNLVAAGDLHLAQGNPVRHNRLGDRRRIQRGKPRATNRLRVEVKSVVRPGESPSGAARLGIAVGQELELLRLVQPLELRNCAAQANRLVGDLDEPDRDEPTNSPVMLRCDREMGNGTGNRVHDHPGKLPALPVGARDVRADDERHLVGPELNDFRRFVACLIL